MLGSCLGLGLKPKIFGLFLATQSLGLGDQGLGLVEVLALALYLAASLTSLFIAKPI